MTTNNSLLGISLAGLGGVCWGLNGIFVKQISGFTPIGIASLRLLIAFIGICVLITILKRWDEVRASMNNWRLFVGLGIFMSIHFVVAVLGFHYTTVANASMLNNTTPIIAAIMAWLFLKEATTTKQWLGIGLAFVGMGFIFSSQPISLDSELFIGNLFAFASAILFAVYTVGNRKLRQNYSWLVIMFWIFGIGEMTIALESVILGDPFILEPTMSDVWNIIGLGVIGTLVGHSAYNMALKHIQASTASTMGLLAPITAAIAGLLILQEVPSTFTLIGIGLSLVGIIVVTQRSTQSKSTSAPTA